jgi:hypothetical protein
MENGAMQITAATVAARTAAAISNVKMISVIQNQRSGAIKEYGMQLTIVITVMMLTNHAEESAKISLAILYPINGAAMEYGAHLTIAPIAKIQNALGNAQTTHAISRP